MYGSWLPSVSTQMLYGLRSSVQVGVLIGVDRLPGRHDRQVRVERPVVLELERLTQLSNFAVRDHLVDRFLARVLRQELLQIVGRSEPSRTTLRRR